jgi:hypothetical protein
MASLSEGLFCGVKGQQVDVFPPTDTVNRVVRQEDCEGEEAKQSVRKAFCAFGLTIGAEISALKNRGGARP